MKRKSDAVSPSSHKEEEEMQNSLSRNIPVGVIAANRDNPLPWYIEPTPTGNLVSKVDWSATTLGAMEDWPMSFKTSMSICLSSRFPMILWLGEEMLLVYNDAYAPLLGKKHPRFIGKPGSQCWSEIWHTIGPMLHDVKKTGKATWTDDLLLVVDRNGYLEETYWTFSYSPIRSSLHQVDGVFTAVEDTSSRYISERRLHSLRDLSAKTSPTSGSAADAVHATSRDALNTLRSNPHDIPYGVLYRYDAEHNQLVLEHAAGVRAGITGISPEVISLDGPHDSAHDFISTVTYVQRFSVLKEYPLPADVAATLGKLPPWNDISRSVVVLPLSSKAQRDGVTSAAGALSHSPSGNGNEADLGVLVLGVNTHQALNEHYFTFLNLVAAQVSSALVASRAYQQERKRAEMLAELDRAKTTFFSNISHEFRTPLTLMIGPLEGILSSPDLPHNEREQLALVHRNGLRLLKLVNVLLDFSRIEAGRMQAVFRPVDLSALTAELASVFRSACEKAQLKLIVNTQPLAERVYVDVDMWEKIVLNLLSNAYKYTLRGSIEVAIRDVDGAAAELLVRDTGCGIPEAEMPRLFERFHRIQTSKGRTHEGTGIGLALVFELVRLHGGSIRAESKEDVGTSFFVTLPYGRAHLPSEHMVTNAEEHIHDQNRRNSHMRNLEWWVETPSGIEGTTNVLLPSAPRDHEKLASILVVDDNSDMQGYVSRILAEHYQVTQGNNGLDALNQLRGASVLPDLILSDIMMPHLDGFGLLKAIRADDTLKDIPMIFLSAQAGEEARSVGIAAGADDYLVKPFSAKELLTRVSARLELARVRAAASRKEQMLREEAERANKSKDHFLAVLSHELRNPLVPVLLVAEAMQTDMSLPQRIRDDLILISRNVQLEVQLINDLLDVTKISQRKLTFQLQRVDAHEMLQYTMKMFTQAFTDKQLRTLLDLTAIDHFVNADSARLQQIYWNLIGNAIKFTPEGGSITLRSRNDWNGPQRKLHIDVIDTGVGIEASVLPKLFNAFEQGGDAVNRKFGGLGLGLSIAKALATMHGGELRVASEGLNKGATFTLTLPAEVTPQSLSVERRHSSHDTLYLPDQPPRSLRILLIEDNITNLKVMERMLSTRLNHRVVSASTFAAAVQALKAHREPFDRILCDLGLPDGNGLDLMPHITATHPHARAIALTGYGTDADVVRSKEAGFSLHLTKPVSLAQLERALTGPEAKLEIIT